MQTWKKYTSSDAWIEARIAENRIKEKKMNINPFKFDLKSLQDDMKALTDRLNDIRATGYAGGDMVSVTLNGSNQAVSVTISDEAAALGRQALETLVCAAINDASEKINAEKISVQQELAQSRFPGLF